MRSYIQNKACAGVRGGGAGALLATILLACASFGCAAPGASQSSLNRGESVNIASVCRPEAVQAVASRLTASHVEVRQITNGPVLADGVNYVAATDQMPAYCQITGSYVTNPETGKTANFLATLPANWNGRYLQLGCSGHCGQFSVSDAAVSVITVSNQGRPGDIIQRGYASFATDEGHAGMGGGDWAIDERGEVNQDAVDDFLIRAQRVLSDMGKEFTTEFYRQASGAPRNIAYSYFSGCSGGGRDALVAASYFPEQFDGIIAGSPYANMVGVAWHWLGIDRATSQAPLSEGLAHRVAATIDSLCDGADGVEDGLVQNPAACDFRPERDLPRCSAGAASNACFTEAQILSVSAYLTAVTDERGAVLQPAISGSNFMASSLSDAGSAGDSLSAAVVRTFAHRNDRNFDLNARFDIEAGGAGAISGYRTIVPRAEFDGNVQALRSGIGAIPENADGLIRRGGRLLIWHNLSDQLLTPYMSYNYYNALAARHGGYEQLQNNVRLFGLPGTIHCSMGGIGVGSFDALGAMEAWVERDEAPNALLATEYASRRHPQIPQLTIVDYDAPPVRTMPLCMYPQMARYSGSGDVNDARNWSCPSNDRRMLTVGESGRRGGVMAP